MRTLPGLLIAALGVAIWLFSVPFPQLENGYPGPALFPRAIATGMVLAATWMIVRPEQRPIRKSAQRGTWYRPVVAIMLVLAFIPAYGLAGPAVAVGIIVSSIAILLHVRILIALSTGIITAGVVHLVFVLLLGVV